MSPFLHDLEAESLIRVDRVRQEPFAIVRHEQGNVLTVSEESDLDRRGSGVPHSVLQGFTTYLIDEKLNLGRAIRLLYVRFEAPFPPAGKVIDQRAKCGGETANPQLAPPQISDHFSEH
ncbi:MAG: hypothetical protein M3Q23_17050 [Actinomycetota bacterium]|nr:hypothetical protein [Actinomycetota bacterium]